MATEITASEVPQLPTEEQLAREKRQLVSRSRPAELLVNDADKDEIVEAITPELRADLVEALNGWRLEGVCALDHEFYEDALTVELGRFLRLVGGSWGEQQRVEWLNQATDDLSEYPLALLLPILTRQRKTQAFANRLVPEIVEQIEPMVRRWSDEGERLSKLLEMANGGKDGK